MDEQTATELVNSLHDMLYAPLVRFAFRVSGREDLAEDAVQETFMKLYRTLREGNTVENPRAWAYTVVRHDLAKRATECTHFRLESLELLDTLPPRNWREDISAIQKDELLSLLAVLSPREEEVLLLRMGSLKYKEIAAELHISIKSVCTMLSRALRKLQRVTGTEFKLESSEQHVGNRPPETLH